MKEYQHLQFPNTTEGQQKKVKTLESMSRVGWRITSETITPGKFNGEKACCYYLICAPCAFLAGSSDGTINLTLEREKEEQVIGQSNDTTNTNPANLNSHTNL
jgi:hypothetical protein